MGMYNKAKVLVLTNHFYPEDFKVNDIAFELSKRGYSITVITAIPDYPSGQFYDGYSLFKRQKEKINDVKIIRLPIIPRRNGNNLRLIINYISYFLSSVSFTIFHSMQNSYNAVFVHMTSPFFINIPGVFLKKKSRIPMLLWVLDLWPESVSAAGGIYNQSILRVLELIVKGVYKNCDAILVGSKGFKKSINEKGNFDSKLIYFPNWAEEIADIQIDEQYKKLEPFARFSPNDFIFLFAGSIGEAQNLDCIIEAIASMKIRDNVKFVFLGEGRKKHYLINKLKSLALDNVCFFPGRFPLKTMPYFMSKADALLVSLKSNKIFSLTVPAKVQFYMAQGKPILAMLDGEGADLINSASCGIASNAGDVVQFRNAVRKFLELDKKALKQMGENGRKYYLENFAKEKRIDQLDKMLKNLMKKD